ncbi:MAG: pyridoxamine 5'-phosphate oxidase family protein, partial [Nitrospira sp.]|nr:pyridoxamine 5'-phosphate oxidase family protein [Nitrospira sp.]
LPVDSYNAGTRRRPMSTTESMSVEAVQAAWASLLERVRIGVLLTMRQGHPFGSHVPFLLGEDWSRVYVHLSRLALHTQHPLDDPRVSLFIAEADEPGRNPLALQRMNLRGTAAILSKSDPAYDDVQQRYLAKFPQSRMLFGFADFALWTFQMSEAHLVLGFGQAYQAFAAAPGQWIHQKPAKQS